LFPNALAVAANIAAARLVWLIPPKPMKSNAPTMIEASPFRKKASMGDTVEFEEEN